MSVFQTFCVIAAVAMTLLWSLLGDYGAAAAWSAAGLVITALAKKP